MSKKIALAAAVAFLTAAAPARAATLLGDTIQAQYLFPDQTSVYNGTQPSQAIAAGGTVFW
jgi:hypothetical protein